MESSSRQNVPRSRRSAISAGESLLWVVAAFFVAMHVYLNVLSLLHNTLTDFHVYHEALGRAARGEAVYDLRAPMPFLYPPFFLILLWPMGWLSEPTAMTVWLYLQNLFLVISLAALVGVFRPFRRLLVAWAVILFAGFSPVMLNNLYGQTNLLYLAILSVFAWTYMRGGMGILPVKADQSDGSDGSDKKDPGQDAHATMAEVLAALSLSLAISIRILPLALLALAVIQRRYKVACWTMGFVAVEALGAGALVGFATEWRYFTSHVFHLHGLENMREISLSALAHRIAPSSLTAAILLTGVAVAGAAVFLAFVVRPIRRRASFPVLPVTFVIASMVLFSPLLEYHHYTILLAPYVLILGDLARRGRLSPTSALPVFLSWAIVSGANQLSHYRFGSMGFAALAGAALIWAYSIWWIAEGKAGRASHPGVPPGATGTNASGTADTRR